MPKHGQASCSNEKIKIKDINEILSKTVNQEEKGSIANDDYKAYPSPASANPHQNNPPQPSRELKRPSKPRRSKLVEPPHHYNYRRISDHFKPLTPPYTEEKKTSGKKSGTQNTIKDGG